MTHVDGHSGYRPQESHPPSRRGDVPTAQQPSRPATGSGAASPAAAQATVFQRLTGVIDGYAGGRYDDPQLGGQIEELRRRLLANGGASQPGHARPGEHHSSSLPTSGRRAPGRAGAGHVQGGGGGARAASGAERAGPAAVAPAPADALRQLATLELQQAQTRLAKVRADLPGRFSAGAAMPSSASGGLDPTTFVPASEEEAAAFAERMAIDLTEGIAQLEVIAATGELAAQSGDIVAAQQAEQQFVRQQAYLFMVAEVVDRGSGNAISQGVAEDFDGAGLSATLAAAKRTGTGEQGLQTIRKLHTMAEDVAERGGAVVVATMQRFASFLWDWVNEEAQRSQRRSEERQRDYEQKVSQDRASETRRERQRSEEAAVEQARTESRAEAERQQALTHQLAQLHRAMLENRGGQRQAS